MSGYSYFYVAVGLGTLCFCFYSVFKVMSSGALAIKAPDEDGGIPPTMLGGIIMGALGAAVFWPLTLPVMLWWYGRIMLQGGFAAGAAEPPLVELDLRETIPSDPETYRAEYHRLFRRLDERIGAIAEAEEPLMVADVLFGMATVAAEVGLKKTEMSELGDYRRYCRARLEQAFEGPLTKVNPR